MNINMIRKKVERVIKECPTEVTVLYDKYKDDKYGGVELVQEGVEKFTTIGVYDNVSRSLSTIESDGGIVPVISNLKFYTLYEEDKQFKVGDYFYIKDEKFTIKNAINILNLNICWQLDLEVK